MSVKVFAMICVLGLVQAASAELSYITQTFHLEGEDGGFDNTFLLGQFNANGADRDLKTIEFEWDVKYTYDVGFENLFAGQQSLSFIGVMSVQVEVAQLVMSYGAGAVNPFDTYAAFDGVVDFDGPSGGRLVGAHDGSGSFTLTEGGVTFEEFLGTDYLNIRLSTPDPRVSDNASFYVMDSDYTSETTLIVRYGYDAVPEPSSMAALALGGLALLRRRSR